MTYLSPSIPSLSDLESFISVAAAGLSQRVTEGDYGGLVEVMGHLLAVKERQHITDSMFEPLQQTIALLKVYEQELPDVVYKQLEVKAGALSCQLLFTATYSFFSFTQLWRGHYFSFVSFNCPSPLCSLAAGNLSSVTAARFAFLLPRHILPISISVRPPAHPHCRSCRRSGTTCGSRLCWSNSRWRRCRPLRWLACVASAPRSTWSSTPSGRLFGPGGPSGRTNRGFV